MKPVLPAFVDTIKSLQQSNSNLYDMLYIVTIYAIVSTLFLLSVPHIFKLFIDPIRIEPTMPKLNQKLEYSTGTGKCIDCTDPSNSTVFTTIPTYTRSDIQKVVQNARIAQNTYKLTTLAERKAILQSIIDYIVTHQDDIIQLSVQCTGKAMTEAAVGEILTTCEKLRWYIANAETLLQRQYRSVPFLLRFTKQAYVEYFPLGVIGIIVPWNYPFHNVISHVATCLITGNSAVVKVSDYTSYSKLFFDKLFIDILSKRNIPINTVQIVTGQVETGQALIEYTDKILFIGSPGVGKAVMSHAAQFLTPVVLELGGKDPFIICNDADLKQVINHALLGAFINCGQNCVSAERFYVQSQIYDVFVDKIKAKIHNIRQGPGPNSDIGAVVMKSQFDKYKKFIDDAVAKGAKLIAGGAANETDQCKSGQYWQLTVLADCTADMLVVQEEVFGPIMTIIKYNTDHELIQQVNANQYGLGSSVYSTDLDHAEKIQRNLVTGMCNINDFATVPLIQSLPFGGCKNSGFGVFNGSEGLYSFCRQQSVVIDRWMFIRTYLPGFLCYPYHKNSVEIVKSAVEIVYGYSTYNSIKKVFSLLRLLQDK